MGGQVMWGGREGFGWGAEGLMLAAPRTMCLCL